jgi:hypothetical protein
MTNPTDEELMELMPQQMRDDLAAAASALACGMARVAGFERSRQPCCRRMWERAESSSTATP